MRDLDAELHELRARIDRAARVCVLSGAGMSAESGIPTFRDALTGLWSRFDPAQLASEEGFRADPRLVWDWYAQRREGVRAAQPNAGHLALGAFAQRRPGVLTVVTQNVDDLHQRAGNADAIRLTATSSPTAGCSLAAAARAAIRARPSPAGRRAAPAAARWCAPAWCGSARCCPKARWKRPSAPPALPS